MKKKKKTKKSPLIITFLILIVGVFGSLCVFKDYFQEKEPEEKPTELDKGEERYEIYSNSLTFAGNILVNSNMCMILYQKMIMILLMCLKI